MLMRYWLKLENIKIETIHAHTPKKEIAAGMNNKETLSKKLLADRVTLFVQFWFKFANAFYSQT